MHTFIDLFAGIGGFRIALEHKGMKCVFSSEIDRHASKVYKRNFGETPEGDICEISEREIPPHDILCAGFPCQSFSISGKQKGMRDNRGLLFYEIVRIAQYHRPYVLLLENVKNILTVDNGTAIQTIENKLREIGYKVHYSTLNAAHFGIPQARERVYFACLRDDVESPEELDYKEPRPSQKRTYLRDVLEETVSERLYINRNDIVIEPAGNEDPTKPIRVGYVNKAGQGERIYSIDGQAITLSANGGGVGARTGLYLVDNRVRRLSLTECKRLMQFPEDFIVSPGIQGYKQLGNAVIPSLIEKVYDGVVIK